MQARPLTYLALSLGLHALFLAPLFFWPNPDRHKAAMETIEVGLVDSAPTVVHDHPTRSSAKVVKAKQPRKKRSANTHRHPRPQVRETPEYPSPDEGVSFEAEGKVNLDYMARLRTEIYRAWVYPDSAISAGHEGTVRIFFVLDDTGRLLEIGLLSSSGHQDLDRAALQAVKDASPFGPFTSDIGRKTLKITGRLRYMLE